MYKKEEKCWFAEMTQQGAALQTYNNELVKSLEELKARRAALQQQIEAESLEKRKLESEKARSATNFGSSSV